MPDVVEIRTADDPRDVIHRAVQHLTAGSLVVLPTETVYVVAASALSEEAVGQLLALNREAAVSLPYLAVKDAAEAEDYIATPTQVGGRLMRRSWPGPVLLQFADQTAGGIAGSLPGATRAAVMAEGDLRLRAPGSEIVYEILNLMACPLVLTSEHLREGRVSVTLTELPAGWLDASAFAIDAEATRYGQPSSEVAVVGEHWRVLRGGMMTERSLARLCSEVYLFVCTGNTCRSPMAEGIFRKLLSERLNCSEDELLDRGFVVASAGLSAALGAPASPESIDLLNELGVDLRSHLSQPLTAQLLDQSDHVFTMTRAHRELILAERPDVRDRVSLLSPDGMDVSDPMGGTISDYQACRAEIERHLRTLLDRLDLNQKHSS